MGKIDEFQLGLLYMGLSVNGITGYEDKDAAHRCFLNVTLMAPDECDGWIGLIATGDTSTHVIYNAWKSRRSLHALTHELDIECLEARVPVGGNLGKISLSLKSPEALSAVQGFKSIDHTDYAWAEELFTEEINPSLLQAFCLAYLAYVTQQWTVVLDIVAQSDGWSNDDDIVSSSDLKQMLTYFSGVACAYLSMFEEALRRLKSLGPEVVSELQRDYHLALIYRITGQESVATSLLQKIYAAQPSPMILNMIEDKSQMIKTVTAESIDNRTNKYDPTTSLDEGSVIESFELLAKADELLHEQIGLTEVKDQVEKLKTQVILKKFRMSRGIPVYDSSNSLIFSGPPGTGKTTIARIVKDIYRSLGIVKTDKFVEARKKDFVAEYLGQTEAKTNKVLDSAVDGVLFIDEVHTLADDKFGIIAAKEIMARMENQRDRLVIIIAGYENEINQFLRIDDGLKSRFSQRIRFTSYTAQELFEIGEYIAHKRENIMNEDAKEVLHQWIFELSKIKEGTSESFFDEVGNARFIRNIIESAERERDNRVFKSGIVGKSSEEITIELMQTISGEDIEKAISQVLGVGKI